METLIFHPKKKLRDLSHFKKIDVSIIKKKKYLFLLDLKNVPSDVVEKNSLYSTGYRMNSNNLIHDTG